jgi:predicted transcriptional regulator
MKIVGAARNSYYKAREFTLLSDTFSNKDKLTMLKMLDSLFMTPGKKNLETSDYDEKPYTQMFFSDLLKFIQTSNLKMNEFKVVLAIYEVLAGANTYGNVLLNFSLKKLSEKTGIPYKNINKDIKSLIEKGVLKKTNDDLFLNYSLFYRGNKIDYDNYKDLYNELEHKQLENNINFELPNLQQGEEIETIHP